MSEERTKNDRKLEILDLLQDCLSDGELVVFRPTGVDGIGIIDSDWSGDGSLGATYLVTLKEVTLEVK